MEWVPVVVYLTLATALLLMTRRSIKRSVPTAPTTMSLSVWASVCFALAYDGDHVVYGPLAAESVWITSLDEDHIQFKIMFSDVVATEAQTIDRMSIHVGQTIRFRPFPTGGSLRLNAGDSLALSYTVNGIGGSI